MKKGKTNITVWSAIKSLLKLIVMLFLSFIVGFGIYHYVLDVIYYKPITITELGQCASNNCIGLSGNTTVRSTSPMVVGQVMYYKCYLEPSGHKYCDGVVYRRRPSNLTEFEAEALNK